MAKLIKETEQQQGGTAPRILSLDDYFTVEKEVPVEGSRKVLLTYHQNLFLRTLQNLHLGSSKVLFIYHHSTGNV